MGQECFEPLLALFDLLKADGIFAISGSRLYDEPSNLHLFKVSVEVTVSRGASLHEGCTLMVPSIICHCLDDVGSHLISFDLG